MLNKAKYILAAVLVSAVVAGCARIEVDEVLTPVSFTTYGQRIQTKADTSYVAPSADFAAGSVAGMYGFYHDASDWATENAAGTNIADFMYHTALTKQSNGSWTYSPIKYWPNEYGTGANSTNVDKLSLSLDRKSVV